MECPDIRRAVKWADLSIGGQCRSIWSASLSNRAPQTYSIPRILSYFVRAISGGPR